MLSIRSISRLPRHADYIMLCDCQLGNYDWYYNPVNNCYYAVYDNKVYRVPFGRAHSDFIRFLKGEM